MKIQKVGNALILIVLLVIAFTPKTAASPSSFYWVKEYGDGKSEGVTSILATPDGGFIVVGHTDSWGAGNWDILVFRIDKNGNIKWQKTFGGDGYDWASDAVITPEGDIIIAGLTNSFGAGYDDVWVLRLDGNGNVKWQKTYGGSSGDYARAVALAPNGDIIVVGQTSGLDIQFQCQGICVYTGLWILRLDGNGNVKWQKAYGNGNDIHASSVKITPDGDIIVAGSISTEGNDYDLLLLKLDEYGNIKWAKTYGGAYWESVFNSNVVVLPNGDFIVASSSASFGIGYQTEKVIAGDLWVLRINGNGDVEWQKTYGTLGEPSGIALDQSTNNVAILQEKNVIVLDENGNVKWKQKYGILYEYSEESITIAEDGIIVGGSILVYSQSDNVWYNDALILKLPFTLTLPDCSFCTDVDLNIENTNAIVRNADLQVIGTNCFVLSPNNVVTTTPNLEIKTLYQSWGTLKISSIPSQASIYINGEYEGETPLTLDVEAGTYTIRISKADYQDYTTTITVEPGETKTINAKLTPAFGYLTIESSPAWAKVYVDGSYIGRTPIRDYKLSVGEHKIEIKKEDYRDYSTTVTIEPGKTATVSANLAQKTGMLKITSEPSGAKVYVDGSYKGTAPLTLTLTPGTYEVKVVKEDYEPYTQRITLSAGESKTINAQLKALFGFLNVYCNVQGAEVYLDGKKIGETPLKGYKLSTGGHKVEIKKEGYQIFTQTITIEPTKTHTINARLELISITSTTTSPIQTQTKSPASPSSSSPASIVPVKTPKLLYIAGLVVLLVLGLIVAKARSKGEPKEKPKPTPAPQEVKEEAPGKASKIPLQEGAKGFPPGLLDKYEPLEFLGEGGFAKVFKVKRKSDGKIVALKIPRIDEKTSSLFLKEIAAWYHLSHPNIVRLYKADILPIPHLEMEFVEGVSVDGKLIRDLDKYPKPVDEKTALNIIKAIANGLAHAHSKGIWHLDLKPLNVLLKSDLTPKITDWGLAKISSRSSLSTHSGYSPLYAAPEQLDEKTYGNPDHRTDIYGLGVIFYELLTGRLPYEGYSPGAVVGKILAKDVKPMPPSKINPALAKYDGIIEKLLAKRKEDRFQSVEEFLRALESLEALHMEREELKKSLEKTKQTLKRSRSREEIQKLTREAVEKTAKIALLSARLNDKAELLNALEDLKFYTRENLDELLNAISQIELMMKEGIPISDELIEQPKVLLHKIEKEV